MNIKEQFELLKTDGEIGYYTHCELTQIFGMRKEDKTLFNIYTLIVFQDKSYEQTETKFLTKKLLPINEEILCGVLQSIFSIEEVIKFFDLLHQTNRYVLDNKDCQIDVLKFLDKQFIVNSNSNDSPQINNILKNNFHNGSYIIEGFSLNKNSVSCLSTDPVKLNAISEKISEILPIKISNVSDRLGNVIFQFPINIFRTKVSCDKDDKKLYLHLELHGKYSLPDYLQITAINKFDNTIVDFSSKNLTSEQEQIEVNAFGIVELSIVNSKNNLVLFYDYVSFSSLVEFNINLLSHQARCFSTGGELQKVPVYSQNNFNTGQQQSLHERKIISQRKYEEQQNDLAKTKDFIQYYGDYSQKAVDDIRSLIVKNSDNGVYLWDPYLSAVDIKTTLYFAPKRGITLRAISGLKQNSSKSNEVSIMRADFESDDKHFLFLNLEVRARIGSHGYDFHDRFLIFPKDKPLVWSLGISVNQLGKSHHILQKVSNPQHILNAFNKLWDELNYPECIVWKS